LFARAGRRENLGMRRRLGSWLVASVGLLCASPARATTINVAPGDSYTKIEGAKAGDEVVIAPGTYGFRVYLTQKAPASSPIVIRAADPTNPPVWDLSAGYVEDAPGSYTAGDRGRGCWQLSGAANIQISGLVITGCHGLDADSAGMRYYEGTSGILLSNLVFRGNDNGLTGGSQSSQITVEYCEFDANGTLLASSSSPSHNIYIYGGDFTLRYSYVHDPVQAQNFHIRAQTSVIEYNWFARAASYAGDLMTDDDYDGSSTFTQSMTLRGNVIVQGTTQSNDSQVVAVYNDAGAAGLTLNVTLLYNTFVGPSSGRASLVHLSNADGTPMNAELDDNLIVGTTNATHIEMTSVGHVTGTHNWLPTGADATGLSATVFGASPGFADPAAGDYTLAAGSTAIGAAMQPASGTPDHEYYRDETVTRMYRLRTTAKDIGAFESTTTGAGIGPDGGLSTGPDGGASGASGSGGAAGSAGGTTGAGGVTGSGGVAAGTAGAGGSAPGTGGGGTGGAKAASSSSGCSCALEPGSPTGLELLALGALLGAARRRRSLSR
jgi:MYXO-CTERM domain-containing protein